MFFQRIFTPGLSIYSYLIGDEKTKRCAVLDPTRLVAPYILAAENAGLTITDIMETHVHADFVSGAKELKDQLNGKPCIHASGLGGKEWIPAYADHIVAQGDQVKLGSIRLSVLHTPGHTPEHIMWTVYDDTRSAIVPWFTFSGDCLFVGSVGRPDLLGPEHFNTLAKQQYHSLFKTLAPLPDFMEIFPSHGAGSLCGKSLSGFATSTLGYERKCNPYLQRQSEEQWVQTVKSEALPIPPYFKRLKKINVEGPSLLRDLTVKAVKEQKELEGMFLLDVRHPEHFARCYLEGAINIPLTSSFCQWAGWLVPEAVPLAIITGRENRISEVIDQLRLIGFDQPIYTFAMKEEEECTAQHLSCFAYISAEDLMQRQKENEANVYILDVRTPAEWNAGHIPTAHHIELNKLYECMHHIPHDCLVVALCRTGFRASTAASLLKKYGFSQVANVKGGMQAWEQMKFPMLPAEK
ncbi:MBL fold metallo-hydrolase [Candidatus Protochlamydia phocaeensis]|uniref:MBL fold metallo-hydrolase n=1 Tax=Candidatus Protochlamydia phocaeensis TaxID=1414722 RepID=UPI0008380032|nr:MBL fold metallo-hydrolase [Candidatus Protochlamydia phocaeensis]